jgi:hypothetical protein
MARASGISTAMDRLLGHLEMARERPSLDSLHRLVREHQLRVPFETLTKLVDWEPGLARGDFLPPLDLYVDRIVTRGAGGLCWTLARGFHALLVDLGFDASLMIMEPGHCCVRVELPEGPHYADVGYAAPIFRAYPLFESFTIATHREAFEYRVTGESILVTRNPGPTKKLDPTPRRLEELGTLIAAANDWNASMSFLHRLVYAGYIDEVYTSFRDGVLRRFPSTGEEKTEVPAADVATLLADLFGVDPALYHEAEAIHRRHRPPAV